MKILSWDVGIKNLAFCLLEKNNDKFTILKWNIINLHDDRPLCDFVLKNNRVCSGIGRFSSLDIHSKIHVTCTKHKNHFLPILIDNNSCFCQKCNSVSIKSTQSKNIAWCDTHFITLSNKYLHKFKSKKLITSKNPIQLLSSKLFSQLDLHPDFLTADSVIIENQPSLLNPVMKTIAVLLYSYFILRCLSDKHLSNSPTSSVLFVSPLNKLVINKQLTTDSLKIAIDKRDKYFITKQLGKIYCEHLIDPPDLIILNKFDKKDDLCDSFLQGFHFMFDVIPDLYLQKLNSIPVHLFSK